MDERVVAAELPVGTAKTLIGGCLSGAATQGNLVMRATGSHHYI
jgi:hypothetical protein